MKKFKRIIATALASVMMMAMSVTAFAAEKATITVENVGTDATLTYAQVIKADTTTTTGWEIVDGYKDAFKSIKNVDDTQELIKAYMDASESVRAAALANVATSATFTNGMEVTSAGLYVINATETGYTYKTMAAYVGMDYTNGAATSLVSAKLNAKKEPTQVDKTVDEIYVEIGEKLTYTVSTTVPYVPAGQTITTKFAVTDTISGANYDVDENNQLSIKVVSAKGEETKKVTVEDNSFTVDLSDLVTDNNEYANTAVTLEYTATATALEIANKAYPTVADHEYKDNFKTVESFSGQISITKYNENKSETLAGAEFVIKNNDGKFATLDSRNYLTGWVDNQDEASKITTDNNGVATAYGFDAEKTYSFVEVTAPTGYALNPVASDVEWDTTPETPVVRIGTAEMKDTKLASLPFTGGMGTTIFTVLGVAIMVLASALYFAAKRRGALK